MSSTLVFVVPDYTQVFIVETDVSYGGIGVFLLQKGIPIDTLVRFYHLHIGVSISIRSIWSF